ncbi:VanZ family protein [Microbacterium sp. ASV49]|uniref:VanZ family protein n=1 Tax=Microbacterium candidum TaxID=3041922 RepID=A0ABT7N2N2_9MICO|nr:VanZ family protein [Microbacterium sp. ASV49]MDL9980976.1 VanZ family protein [Microbacterium sp. ASV49]
MPAQSDIVEDRSTWRLLTTRAKVETVVIWVVFALYVAFLLKLLLLSRTPGSERSINLIPFASVADYLFSGSAGTRRFAFGNIAGNVLLFIPLGAYLSLLTRMTIAKTMLVIASVSVAVEIIQGLFALGASDIDDVILNCLGGLLGILLFVVLRAVLRGRSRARTAIAVLSVLALPVLYYFLFVIRLRM